MGKYIDGSGLSHFMGILKGYFVPQTRKINNKALSSDVTLYANDIPFSSGVSNHSVYDELEDLMSEIPVGAEVNQNAFSNVKVGSTTVAADTKTDTLELAAGSNVTLTPDATNDKVTIAAADTHHTAYLRAGASGGTANAETTTGNTYLNLVENGANRSGVKLVPGTAMSITSDASGNVTFTSSDTKNTAGSTNSTSKLFLIGATSQAANPQTYSNSSVYTQNGWLYVDGQPVVDEDSDQDLNNKTYEGYTLGAACAKGVDTSIAAGSTSTNVPTTAAVVNYMTNVAGALVYKGTVGTGGTVTDLPANHTKGWYYVVKAAGTYAGIACEAGDMIICNTSGTSANNAHWDAVQSNIEVLSNSEIDTLWVAA